MWFSAKGFVGSGFGSLLRGHDAASAPRGAANRLAGGIVPACFGFLRGVGYVQPANKSISFSMSKGPPYSVTWLETLIMPTFHGRRQKVDRKSVV